jgi:hypothetical protein
MLLSSKMCARVVRFPLAFAIHPLSCALGVTKMI